MFVQTKCVLSFLIIPLVVQTPAPDTQLNNNAIDAYIASKMRWPRIPGLALAIVKDDRIVYLKSYGEADPSGRPVTPQTPFILGSVTKSFTSLAVMQLVEAGKVELDAPVQKYIPWFRVAEASASSQITVRQLLYQTSGLPMMREPQLDKSQDDGALERTVRSFTNAQLNDRPLPDQGRGIRRLYLIFDLVIVALTALLLISFLRIGRRYRSRRMVLKAAAHFVLLLLIFLVVVKVPLWGVLVMLQPDLARGNRSVVVRQMRC